MNPEKTVIELNQGQQLFTEGNFESAIASYFCEIRQNPNESWPHHQLGEALTRLRKFDAAVTAYRHATKLNPEAVESHYQLGNVLSRLQHWDEAIAAYQQALHYKPNFLEAYYQLVELCVHQNQWDESISYYQKACELEPSLRVVDFFNKDFPNWEPLATACLRALVQNTDSSSLYSLLGEVLMYLRKSEQSITTFLQSYLAISVPEKEDAFRFCHNLAIQLSNQGFLEEGTACFQAAQIPPGPGEMYDHIWKGLNQLGVLDESNPYYQIDINPEEAKNHFMQTSQYRTIILESLTDDDNSFLEKSGISLTNLQLITQDKRVLEEIYINSFSSGNLSNSTCNRSASNDSPPIKLTQKVDKKFAYYQQSLVETGYIYAVCPVSGRILRSNQSVYIQHNSFLPTGIYRFAGNEIFYLIFGCHHSIWLAIYFPRLELIVRPANNPFSTDYFTVLNELKGGAVAFWQQFKSYISNQDKKEIAAVVGWLGNLGHYFWNDLSGIQSLSDNQTLSKVNKFLMGNYNFFNLGEIFPEIPSENIVQIPDRWSLLRTTLENNYFTVRLTDLVIKERLASNIYQAAISRCSQDFLQDLEKAKKHFPLVWIQIRLRYRVWVSQVEGIANIIKSLHLDYPNLGVVIVGNWYFTETDEIEGCPQIENEKATLEQIQALLPPNINLYNIIGRPSYEIMAWANAIDTYIVPFASGITFVAKLANKVGVIHTTTGLAVTVEPTVLSMRENAVSPVVPRDIVDVNAGNPVLCDYDCDWKGIYDEVVKIINNLDRNK